MDKINNHHNHIGRNIFDFILGIAVTASVLWLARYILPELKDLSPASLRNYIQSFGNLAAVFYIIIYVLDTLALFPPMAGVAITAGLAFGPFWGFIYLMIATLIGTHLAFLIARAFGRGLIEKIIEKKFKNIDDILGRNGFKAVLFLRIIPVIPYEFLNYVSGLSKVRLKEYSLATAIGLIPGVLISVFFGDSLAGVSKFKDIFSFKIIIATILLISLALIPFIYNRLKKKKT